MGVIQNECHDVRRLLYVLLQLVLLLRARNFWRGRLTSYLMRLINDKDILSDDIKVLRRSGGVAPLIRVLDTG